MKYVCVFFICTVYDVFTYCFIFRDTPGPQARAGHRDQPAVRYVYITVWIMLQSFSFLSHLLSVSCHTPPVKRSVIMVRTYIKHTQRSPSARQ